MRLYLFHLKKKDSLNGKHSCLAHYQALLSLLLRPVRGLSVTSFTEAVHYPWLRYRVNGPSSAVYEKLQAEYTAGSWSISLQDYFVFQSSDLSRKHSLKAVGKLEKGRWNASLRLGGVALASGGGLSFGKAASLECSGSFSRGRLLPTAGLSFYDTDGYATRIYLYASDLPYTMNFLYYYGKGIAARGLVKFKIGKKCVLSALAAFSAGFECRLQTDFNF